MNDRLGVVNVWPCPWRVGARLHVDDEIVPYLGSDVSECTARRSETEHGARRRSTEIGVASSEAERGSEHMVMDM